MDDKPRLEKMDRDFEMDQIRRAVDAIMSHFGNYVKDCNLGWPICYKCGDDMCQVVERAKNSYFQCFECGHKEFGI